MAKSEKIKPLWFATYIDGDETTTDSELRRHHSVSCSQQIAREHIDEFLRHMDDVFVDPDFPVPSEQTFLAISKDAMGDWVSDAEGHPWMDPYREELLYMLTRDPCSMDCVYLHRREP